jgi:FkbM family methyltransferase
MRDPEVSPRVRDSVKRYLLGAVARPALQAAFRGLHRVALAGMNIGTASHVVNSGERRILRAIAATDQRTGRQPVIFDVGANVGQFAREAHAAWHGRARIICFEPSREAFRRLTATVSSLAGIELVPIAVGDAPGDARLYTDGVASGLASLYRRPGFAAANGGASSEPVAVTTIDRHCAQHGIEYVSYLKLDIEGHELAALAGAAEMRAGGRIDCIQFEFGGCNVDSRTYMRDFYDLLSPAYDLHRIVRGGAYPIGTYSERLEIFSTTNFLAVRRGSPYAGGW